MPKKKFSDEQIAFADGGTAIVKICREIGVSKATFYRSKSSDWVCPRSIALLAIPRLF